jgi:hypothetical protein
MDDRVLGSMPLTKLSDAVKNVRLYCSISVKSRGG